MYVTADAASALLTVEIMRVLKLRMSIMSSPPTWFCHLACQGKYKRHRFISLSFQSREMQKNYSPLIPALFIMLIVN